MQSTDGKLLKPRRKSKIRDRGSQGEKPQSQGEQNMNQTDADDNKYQQSLAVYDLAKL